MSNTNTITPVSNTGCFRQCARCGTYFLIGGMIESDGFTVCSHCFYINKTEQATKAVCPHCGKEIKVKII